MNRTTIMKFRATEEEASEIRRKAAAAGMTVSRFLRTSAVNSQVVLYNTADLSDFVPKSRKSGTTSTRLQWWQIQTNRCICPMSESCESSLMK